MDMFEKACASFHIDQLDYSNIINDNTGVKTDVFATNHLRWKLSNPTSPNGEQAGIIERQQHTGKVMPRTCLVDFNVMWKFRGYVKPLSIMNLLESIREEEGDFHIEMIKEYLADEYIPAVYLVKWQQVEMRSKFYRIPSARREKGEGFSLRHYVGRVCGFSQRFGNVLLTANESEPLLFSVGVMINFNVETSSPDPFPECVSNYFNSRCHEYVIANGRQIPDRCTERTAMPPDAASLSITSHVREFQLDDNNHTYESNYAGMCFDCLSWAQTQDLCQNLELSISSYPIRRMSFLYFAKSTMHEDLHTTVWQDDCDKWIFHFHIKRNQELICQAEFQLFPSGEVV